MYLHWLSFRGHVENKYLLLPNYGFPCLHFKIIKIPFTTSRNAINSVKKPYFELSKSSLAIAFSLFNAIQCHGVIHPLSLSHYQVSTIFSLLTVCSVNIAPDLSPG